MDDGDFVLGRLDRLEKRLEALGVDLKKQDRLLMDHFDMPGHFVEDATLGVSDSPDKPV